ncbi:autotransporter outer membrane beta-barrel domain-containing protein [Bradyrhizobium lablabi]|uniref:autotransporter family protein n=1 Tax=Bradyrhizobium lablabi TaxID=722472 RepID=UPI001FCDFA07|nr:autotransporter outer membrane beta-barrel domain-containing protein [Bradyrhizobium lablabi]
MARSHCFHKSSPFTLGSVLLVVGWLALLSRPTFAGGGAGGTDGLAPGGTGGVTSATGTGGTGGNGTGSSGGGGGGAGAIGGGGGAGFGGSTQPGGAGGATAGAAGVNGTGAGDSGGGGGGGAHGAVVTTTTTNAAAVAGGSGGGGGGALFGGGGGGAGGYGVVVNGSGFTYTNNSAIGGGNGGRGGDSTIVFATSGNGGDGGIGIDFTGSGTLINSGSITGGNGGAAGAAAGTNGSAGAGAAGIVGSGLTITNSGTISGGFAGDGTTRANAITFTGGINALTFTNATSGLTGNIGIGVTGSVNFAQATNVTVSNVITGSGQVIKTGAGTLTLTGTNTFQGGTIIDQGRISVSSDANLGDASGSAFFAGGTLEVTGAGFTAGRAIFLAAGAGGTIQVDAGTLTLSGVVADFNFGGPLIKTGAGTLILSNANTYIDPTFVNGGTLVVDGSIATSSLTTVNSGATLSGTGTVGPTTITGGGILAPGNAFNPTGVLAVTGNLAFQSGAVYLVQVTPSAAARTSVSGTAGLGGATVNAVFANGSYISKQYTILTAAGVSGTFGSLVNTNLPANFSSSLSYDFHDAFLNLTLNFTPPSAPNFGGGLNGNQQNVANTLVNFFNTTGGIPLAFGTLSPAGLTQASGEIGAGSQQTTFNAMGQFLGLLTDPFMGRGNGVGGASATPYAEESASSYAARRRNDAFAMFTKAPPAPFVPRWSVWAAGFGGSQSTDGNALVGSNDTRSSIFGTAVGADYLFSPNTLAGFALAGGGTNFSVNNLGSGRSDLFQAGAYVRHTAGNAYISGALAYGWQDITTNRTVTIAGFDQLRAEFNANAYSGRLEGGYRFVAPWIGGVGITPYAAGQFTTFDLPAYAERVVTGAANFALNYAAKSVTDTRSELGIRTDKSFAVQNGILTLRGRLAWAHDFDPDRNIAATFQALPGASFVVGGAAQAPDSALTTASAEMKWMNGWSAAATFEGEFSNVTRSYAGKGTVRYTW